MDFRKYMKTPVKSLWTLIPELGLPQGQEGIGTNSDIVRILFDLTKWLAYKPIICSLILFVLETDPVTPGLLLTVIFSIPNLVATKTLSPILRPTPLRASLLIDSSLESLYIRFQK